MPRTDISEQEYNNIKKLLELKVKPKDIISITGRSAPSINRVRKSASFKGFNHRVGRKMPPRKKEVTQPVQTSLVHDMPVEDIYTRLDAIDKRLQDIGQKIDTMFASNPKNKRRLWS